LTGKEFSMNPLRLATNTRAPAATILVRFMVGAVFLSEGLQKFIFPDLMGAGRFMKIGIFAPHITAPFVGVCEIICGAMLLAGLLTRLAAVPMIIDMLVAISTTKISFLVNEGFWKMAHEARVDYAMLLGCAFLLIVGAGPLSVDVVLAWKAAKRAEKK
jgi:putative oxidoreductase